MIRNRRLIATATLAGAIFASGLLDKKDEVELPEVETISSVEVVEPEVERSFLLTRRYLVQSGDNLSTLAMNAFSSVSELKSINQLKSDTIYIGDTLTIPYIISSEDLDLYLQSVSVEDQTLDEIAAMYETDVSTIYRLNLESIAKVDGEYVILSKTIMVPKFITRSQYNDIKGNHFKTYER